jgi:hypothetical protein
VTKSLNAMGLFFFLLLLEAGWSAGTEKDTAGKTTRPQRTTAGAMGERFTYQKLGDSGGPVSSFKTKHDINVVNR